MIPKESIEQRNIIDIIRLGKNVIVTAQPGAGKTTLAIMIANNCPDKNVTLVTYNRHLADDTKKRTRNIKNLRAYTIHGLASAFYCTNGTIHDDRGIQELLTENSEITRVPDVDIFIIDEAQDMCIFLYQFCRKFVRDIHKVQLVILGDPHQAVYEYRGSDRRCLTHAHLLWKDYCEFEYLSLRTSYRLTESIANFINFVILGNYEINVIKTGPAVKYYCINAFNRKHMPKSIENIIKKIKSGRIKADDVFVLANSTKSVRSPIRCCERYFSNNGIACYVAKNDIDNPKAEEIKNKVVFTTFCSAKGRERDIVILYGFDDFYTANTCTPANPTECPTAMFVALSRPRKKLIIIHHYKNDLPSFVKLPLETFSASPYVKFRGTLPQKQKEKESPPNVNRAVSELTAHLKSTSSLKLESLIKSVFMTREAATLDINIPSHIPGKYHDTIENVSMINGLVIPFMFERGEYSRSALGTLAERKRGGQSTKDAAISTYLKKASPGEKIYKKFLDKITISPNTTEEYLKATMLYYSLRNNFIHTLNQINDYNWLSDDSVKKCNRVLEKYISRRSSFEIEIEASTFYESKEIYITGVIDVYDKDTNTIYELKCVNELTFENYIQLSVYAWLILNNESWNEKRSTLKYMLLNFRTGEMHELLFNERVLQLIIDVLIEDKFSTQTADDDKTFITRFNDVRTLHEDNILPIESFGEPEELPRQPSKRLARRRIRS